MASFAITEVHSAGGRRGRRNAGKLGEKSRASVPKGIRICVRGFVILVLLGSFPPSTPFYTA
jgi:hypothetical protein